MISAQISRSFTYLFQRNASFLREPQFFRPLAQYSFSSAAKKDSRVSESIKLYLKEIGLSDAELENAFKHEPRLPSVDLEKSIKPKIKTFDDFGFSNSEIAVIISRAPKILFYSLKDRVIPSMCFLKDLLGSSHDDMFKVLKRFGWFLTIDLKKHIWPNIEHLHKYGVPMEHILRHFRSFPRSLCINNATLMRRIDKLEALGMNDAHSKMYIHAFRVVGGMSNEVWERKLQAFRDLGFTETEISAIFKTAPVVFSTSPEKLRKTMAVLLSTKKYGNAAVVSCAAIFSRSIEKRLKPRVEILKILEKMNLIEKWPSLGVVAIYSSKRFHDTFVAPHISQLQEAFPVKSKRWITNY
ncbi:hypothetical protein M569_09002 [Genlisea aurea]|uniref:Mitochondrial transcription termination factor family protein n=1 Tax=Genlisea aurea TaxID=192259 RepID=S8E0C6_9LAMI|nr:hypothetical protein M569_09002 [Genlisea aurea]